MTPAACESDLRQVMGVQEPTDARPPAVRHRGPTPQRTAHPRADDAVHLVKGFLRDVRSGRALHLAPHYLADVVVAHQGPPGARAPVVSRSPQQYADHVAEMVRDHGPWDFAVLHVAPVAHGVVASWRQLGSRGRRPLERGRATYRVERGLIAEYWIQAEHRTLRHERTRRYRSVDVVTHVTAPPRVVWRLLGDMDSWAQWGPWSDSRQASRAGPSILLSHTARRSTLEQVVAAVPEQRLSFETLAGTPVSGARTDVTLRPDGTGTTVWWHVSCDGALRAAVAQPLLALSTRRVLRSLARAAEHDARLDRAFGRRRGGGSAAPHEHHGSARPPPEGTRSVPAPGSCARTGGGGVL